MEAGHCRHPSGGASGSPKSQLWLPLTYPPLRTLSHLPSSVPFLTFSFSQPKAISTTVSPSALSIKKVVVIKRKLVINKWHWPNVNVHVFLSSHRQGWLSLPSFLPLVAPWPWCPWCRRIYAWFLWQQKWQRGSKFSFLCSSFSSFCCLSCDTVIVFFQFEGIWVPGRTFPHLSFLSIHPRNCAFNYRVKT